MFFGWGCIIYSVLCLRCGIICALLMLFKLRPCLPTPCIMSPVPKQALPGYAKGGSRHTVCCVFFLMIYWKFTALMLTAKVLLPRHPSAIFSWIIPGFIFLLANFFFKKCRLLLPRHCLVSSAIEGSFPIIVLIVTKSLFLVGPSVASYSGPVSIFHVAWKGLIWVGCEQGGRLSGTSGDLDSHLVVIRCITEEYAIVTCFITIGCQILFKQLLVLLHFSFL